MTHEVAATTTAGVTFATQPVIAEDDAHNSLVTADSTCTVTVSRGSQGTAALQGTTLTVTLQGGVATFSGLAYNKAETLNLNFTSSAGGVASVTSTKIGRAPCRERE